MFIQKITTNETGFGSQKLSGAAKKALRKALKPGVSKPQKAKSVTRDVLPYLTAGTAAVSVVPVTFSQTVNNDWFKLGKNENGEAFTPDIFQKASYSEKYNLIFDKSIPFVRYVLLLQTLDKLHEHRIS